eukprot:233877-Pelagomonas_calceolata.AAC.2
MPRGIARIRILLPHSWTRLNPSKPGRSLASQRCICHVAFCAAPFSYLCCLFLIAGSVVAHCCPGRLIGAQQFSAAVPYIAPGLHCVVFPGAIAACWPVASHYLALHLACVTQFYQEQLLAGLEGQESLTLTLANPKP